MENPAPEKLDITSENKQTILEILDGLRERAQRDEILQLFIVVEDPSGFEGLWPGSEDRMTIAAFAIRAAFERMGFASRSDQD